MHNTVQQAFLRRKVALLRIQQPDVRTPRLSLTGSASPSRALPPVPHRNIKHCCSRIPGFASATSNMHCERVRIAAVGRPTKAPADTQPHWRTQQVPPLAGSPSPYAHLGSRFLHGPLIRSLARAYVVGSRDSSSTRRASGSFCATMRILKKSLALCLLNKKPSAHPRATPPRPTQAAGLACIYCTS